jgi:hypothetical protein
MESLLSSAQATDLVGLLAVVSVQTHLGHEYREEADYWAGQVDPGLAADDARTIVRLLEGWPAHCGCPGPWSSGPAAGWSASRSSPAAPIAADYTPGGNSRGAGLR